MTTYIVRRLISAIVVLFLISLVVFFAMRLLPGDPLIIFMGRMAEAGSLSEEQMQSLRVEYGLDKPLMIQYFNWLGNVFRGNLGTSIYYHENVGSLMARRFPVTLHLGLVAFSIEIILGIIMGTLAAVRRGTWIDSLSTTLANIGVTIPQFWLGILMIYIFGLKLGWLPISGYTSPVEDFWLSTRKIIMPVICLAITGVAFTARQMRSSMLEVIRQDYIRTAWSKGLGERFIIIRHALKNSLIPVITMLGLGLGMIFGGSVVVETIFAIPGIGRLLVSSIFAQDYVVIQSGTLVISAIIIMVNLFVDISYGWLDPRIRFG
ncbi:MAG: ABC transporter permease [Dehalococcoidales bacterium]|nr:ABC transporter permease [Dehalococcoidales bacterium]